MMDSFDDDMRRGMESLLHPKKQKMPKLLLPLEAEAAVFADDKHRGQERKYTHEPYINHPIAVAGLVRSFTNDEEVIAAAYLHDTLEDTDATRKEIAEMFGGVVLRLVCQLTDYYTHERFPNKNREERKALEAERLGSIDDNAKIIKYCDLIDNTSSIVRHDPKFAVTYLREKANILEAMKIWEIIK